jgi:hypothetical protein
MHHGREAVMSVVAIKNPAPTKSAEQTPWNAADTMQGNQSGEYKHVRIGLDFLAYISGAIPTSLERLKPKRFMTSCGIQEERR